MSQKVARILNEPEHVVTKLLRELEEKNGWPSHDARYLADNVQKTRARLSDLGLDPDDTTGRELYHALLAKFEKNSRLFDLHFGTDDMNFDQKSAKAAELITKNFELPNHWALKTSIAKVIMRQQPPKRVMKHLSYRSLESMLKRENLNEIYLAASHIESDSWRKAHSRLVSKLSQLDFELRPLTIVHLDEAKWSDFLPPESFIIQNYEVGAMSLWPSAALNKASLLTISLLLTDQIGQTQPASGGLAKISGILEWWSGMDHLVAELAGEHVSLNLKDCALNNLFNNHYDRRTLKHGASAFWHELLNRYEHLPPAEALFDNSVREKVAKLRFDIPEPIYEFAEEFDG